MTEQATALRPTHWSKSIFSAPNVVLGLLCILYFSAYVDRVNISTTAGMMRKEFGISNVEMGVVFSAFAYPYVLFMVFGGWLADRFGARRVLMVCVSVAAVATFCTSLVSGVVGLFMCRLLLGFGESVMFPSATRGMQAWIPSDRYGFVQGITHSFSRLGNAVTPPIVAALVILWGWRGSFAVMGVMTLAWVGFWVYYYRDDPRDHPKIRPEDLIGLPERAPAKARKIPWLRLGWRMAPVTFTYFCYGWSAWVYLNWLPSFFFEGQGFDLKKSAAFASGVFFAGVVGDTVGGLMSDAVKRRTGNVKLARLSVLWIGMLGSAVCLTAMMYLHDIMWISLALAAGFFFLELVIAPAWAVPMDIAPQYAGTASAMMNIGFAVAGILSSVSFGWILDLTGNWYLPFLCSIGLMLAGTMTSLLMHPERPFIDEPA
ncbi:MFS family permease [Rhodopseudomonas rhenobacensis]|uniref:MFS family permease n=1 Tax=Rhodopseudomonas rhenobacensis TaxID=87461 RepID=A0A7W7Z1I8_9BRAD|nr:MFS family permease [Rhodopseudomonas rhenobacensis]